MKSDHPLGSVAALKRALTPGTKLRLVNHVRPHASRITTVLPKTNTVDLVTAAESAPRGSHLRWPKAAELRPGPDDRTVHIDKEGEPFLTITVVDEHDAEPDWDTSTAYDLCKTCGSPVAKKNGTWVHEAV